MGVKTTLAIACCLLFGLSGCGGGGGSSSGSYSPYGGTAEPTRIKIGKPYRVRGITYTPKYDAHYDETGMASWYGPKFHGRMTASGEKYDQYEMTAAHRTLPMPSIVRVTRLDSGRSIIVRINDRGPFAHGRIIDLSKKAADELDMIRDGTARVRVQYLTEETEMYVSSLGLKRPDKWKGPPPAATAYASRAPVATIATRDLAPISPAVPKVITPQKPAFRFDIVSPAYADIPPSDSITGAEYRIQTASFSNRRNAEGVASRLQEIAATLITPITNTNGTRFYRVSLGPLLRYDEAQRVLARVQAMGYRDARIIVDG